MKLLDAATGKKVWQSYGVDSLFAVSSDGKLVATLPPPVPRQHQGMAPMPASPPKQAPMKLPPPIKSAGAPSGLLDSDDVGFVALQAPKKVQPAPAPAGPVPAGPGEPEMVMPPPMIPSPPITLWVVDDNDKDGQPVRRTLPMPGKVTMMRFSPDGKYLAAYIPHVLEQVPQTRTRKVVMIIDGQRVEKEEVFTVLVKRDISQLKVFDTTTGNSVLTHVGASGLAIFCQGGGHIASAAGMPKFGGHMIDGIPPADYNAPRPEKMMPGPPPKAASAFRPDRRHVAALGQGPFAEPPALAASDDVEPVAWAEHGDMPGVMPYVDTALYIFDLKTGKETHKFHGHAGQITALAFSPDCKLLASGSYGVGTMCGDPPGKHFAQINIWDLGAKKLFQSISGHTGAINCMEFDPQGKRLASASDDATVKVWTVAASLNTSSPGYAVPAGPPVVGGAVVARDSVRGR